MKEITDTDRLNWLDQDGHSLYVGYADAIVTTRLGTYRARMARAAIDQSIRADIAHEERATERG